MTTPAQIATLAAEKRRAMLEKLQPVRTAAREKLGELQQTRQATAQAVTTARAEADITRGNPFDLFPTPAELAAQMVQIADIRQGQTVLEPSAGTGRIADAARNMGAIVTCIEFNQSAAEFLQRKGHTVHAADWMSYTPPALYDAVLMNPPFSNGADIDHTRRAWQYVRAGGVLVAIMGEGAFFRSDRKATAFRAWLEDVNGYSEALPAGTFAASGTNVNTRIVTIHKP